MTRFTKFSLSVFTIAGLAATGLHAQTFSAPGYVETFTPKTDTYVPALPGGSFNFGAVPALSPGVSEHPNNLFDDWSDVRGGPFGPADGLIESVASGYDGVTSASGPNHGVVYLSGNGPYPYGSYGGPVGRAGRSTVNPRGVGVPWSSHVDVYLDSRMPISGPSGGIQWQSSASRTTPGPYGFYMTEGGVDINRIASGYTFALDYVGTFTNTTMLDQWVTLEQIFDPTIDPGGSLYIIFKLWSGDKNYLLGSVTNINYLTTGAPSSLLGGPRTAFWFFNPSFGSYPPAETDTVGFAIDNLVAGDAIIPEPTCIALLALGGFAFLRRRKRA